MNWEGEFTVPGRPDEVVLEFADARRMAAHMPGAEIEAVSGDGTLSGKLTVAFGPKRLVFRGKAVCEADIPGLKGRIVGQGASDMRAARFKVELDWSLRDDAASPTPATVVTLRSAAALQGVLADFARSGGPIVAAALTEEFAARLKRDLEVRNGVEPSAEPAPGGDLSGARLMGAVARHSAREAGRSIAGMFRRGSKEELRFGRSLAAGTSES